MLGDASFSAVSEVALRHEVDVFVESEVIFFVKGGFDFG